MKDINKDSAQIQELPEVFHDVFWKEVKQETPPEETRIPQYRGIF
jgi:hypothetical protein